MRQSPLARFLLGASAILCSEWSCPSRAQQPPPPQQQSPSQQPPPTQQAPSQQPAQSTNQPAQTKKPAAVPAAPQSTHYPILLLVQGNDQSWNLRIGLRGPERLDRTGYPPIPLEPAEVVREGTTDSWTYHAKDSQTGAAVSVRIMREPCSDLAATAKFPFSASMEHAQIGSRLGCARVATELFPKINNQPTDDEVDAKDKPAPPTITHFKPPVYVAYINGTGKLIIKRGTVARAVPGKAGYQPALSRDGKRLLYTTDDKAGEKGGERTISLYDWATGKSSELLRGFVQQPLWSPDETHVAFLKSDGSKWQVWTMPRDNPEKATLLYPGETLNLDGWTDAQTILAGDLETLSWVGEDGTVKQSVSGEELYGKEQFSLSSSNTVRIHPLNPDLLLVSAEVLPPPAAAASKNPAAGAKDALKDAAKEAATQPGQAFFLFEIRSKRRVLLSPSNLSCSFAEWSRDGLQIFFTCREPSSTAMTIYKMFWDGTTQLKVQGGYSLVIGQ